jgi:hypothetical protein
MKLSKKPIIQHGIVFCCFESSKLLKELGFTDRCVGYYDTWRNNLRKADQNKPEDALRGLEYDNDQLYPHDQFLKVNEAFNTNDKSLVAAPTQQQVLEWLWRNYDMSVEVELINSCDFILTEQPETYIPEEYDLVWAPTVNTWDKVTKIVTGHNFSDCLFDTREGAYEHGILLALRTIKDEK